MSQSSSGLYEDDLDDYQDREPQSASPADTMPEDTQDRQSSAIDSPRFELPSETDSTATEAQTPTDDGAPSTASDIGIPISGQPVSSRAPGVVSAGRSPASVRGAGDDEVSGAWDALNSLQPPAPSVHRVGQAGMSEDQLEQQGQRQDAANEQEYSQRQAGLFKYLHESGLSVSTGPDGQPRVDTDQNGAPVWQPVKTQPYTDQDGNWVRKTRDSSGQVQEVNLKDSGEYTVNPRTGDMLINDGSGQRISIGKDQPTVNRLAISSQRTQLQQQNQADQIAIAQIHQAVAPLRQQYTALLNSSPSIGGEVPTGTVKQLEQQAASTDPTMSSVAASAQESLQKFNAEHPEYQQAKQALAAAQQTVATKMSAIQDRKLSSLILATNPNAPAVGALAGQNYQDPASPGMAPGQTTSDAIQVGTAATAAQNGITQLAALPATLARLKAAGVTVPTVTPAQLKTAATPATQPDTGFDALEFGKRILTSAASGINGAFKGAAMLAGNQDVAQWFRSNQADMKNMNNPDKDDLTSSKWAEVIGGTLAAVPGTVIAGALAPEAIGIGAVGALAKVGQIAWNLAPIATQFALAASGDAFDAAKQQGQTDEQASQSAASAGWKTTRALPAYMILGAAGGKIEGAIASKLSANPELMNPFLKGVSALFTHSAANITASSAMRALEGEPWQPTMENIRPDIAFAGQGAISEGLHQAGSLASGRPARAAFGGTSADIPDAKRPAYTPIAQAILDGSEPSVSGLDRMAIDPKVSAAQQQQAKSAADLMRYNAQEFLDRTARPDQTRQYRDLLTSQDDLHGKYQNAPDEATRAGIVDQTTANTAQMHGILQDRIDSVPPEQRAAVARAVEPTTDVESVERQLTSAPTAFAAQSIGSDPGVRAAYVEPAREAQIQKIAERTQDPAASARLADQHVGMQAARDLWGVVSDSKPIDQAKATALADPNVGLLAPSTDQNGAPVMKLTHDALPLLTDGQRAAVAANPGRFLIDSPAGTPQAMFRQHVRSGEQKGLAMLNRPGPVAAPRQHNVTLTTQAPGETAPSDKTTAVLARSEREAHGKAVSLAQRNGHRVIDSGINPAIQPRGGITAPERTLREIRQAVPDSRKAIPMAGGLDAFRAATKEAPVDAVWSNKGSDTPVRITGVMGESNGETYLRTDGGTGIPSSEVRVPGATAEQGAPAATGFRPVSTSEFTPDGRLAAAKVMQGFRDNKGFFAALGIDSPTFARIADRSKSGLATSGRSLVIDGDLLHEHFQNLAKTRMEGKRVSGADWVGHALNEEIIHAAQRLGARKSGVEFEKFYTDLRSDPKLDPKLIAAAREAYTGFDQLSPSQQGAEIARMVIQGRWKGTITERIFQAIQHVVDFLKGLNVGHSELLDRAVRQTESVLDEARQRAESPDHARETPEPVRAGAETPEPVEKASNGSQDERGNDVAGDQGGDAEGVEGADRQGRGDSASGGEPEYGEDVEHHSPEEAAAFLDAFHQEMEGNKADMMRENGYLPLHEAVTKLGGLPSKKHPLRARYGQEINQIQEAIATSNRNKFKRDRIRTTRLFNETADSPDIVAGKLGYKGPNELFDALHDEINSGKPNWTQLQSHRSTGMNDETAMFAARVNKQTESQEFKSWFGESKVVGDDGKPLVLFHATDGPAFEAFDKEMVKSRFPYSFGFHFTTRPEEANAYGDKLIPVFAKLDRPLEIKSEFPTASMEADLNRGPIIRKLVDAMKSGRPYDGVIIKSGNGGNEYDHWNVIAFNPEQIKSAIGNSGKFDPNEPSMLGASRARDTGTGDLFGQPKLDDEALKTAPDRTQNLARWWTKLNGKIAAGEQLTPAEHARYREAEQALGQKYLLDAKTNAPEAPAKAAPSATELAGRRLVGHDVARQRDIFTGRPEDEKGGQSMLFAGSAGIRKPLRDDLESIWPGLTDRETENAFTGPFSPALRAKYDALDPQKQAAVDSWFEKNEGRLSQYQDARSSDAFRDTLSNYAENNSPKEFGEALLDRLQDVHRQTPARDRDAASVDLFRQAGEIARQHNLDPQQIKDSVQRELARHYGEAAPEMTKALFGGVAAQSGHELLGSARAKAFSEEGTPLFASSSNTRLTGAESRELAELERRGESSWTAEDGKRWEELKDAQTGPANTLPDNTFPKGVPLVENARPRSGGESTMGLRAEAADRFSRQNPKADYYMPSHVMAALLHESENRPEGTNPSTRIARDWVRRNAQDLVARHRAAVEENELMSAAPAKPDNRFEESGVRKIPMKDLSFPGGLSDEVTPLKDNSRKPIIVKPEGGIFRILDGFGRASGLKNSGAEFAHAIVASPEDIAKNSGAADDPQWVGWMHTKYAPDSLMASGQKSFTRRKLSYEMTPGEYDAARSHQGDQPDSVTAAQHLMSIRGALSEGRKVPVDVAFQAADRARRLGVDVPESVEKFLGSRDNRSPGKKYYDYLHAGNWPEDVQAVLDKLPDGADQYRDPKRPNPYSTARAQFAADAHSDFSDGEGGVDPELRRATAEDVSVTDPAGGPHVDPVWRAAMGDKAQRFSDLYDKEEERTPQETSEMNQILRGAKAVMAKGVLAGEAMMDAEGREHDENGMPVEGQDMLGAAKAGEKSDRGYALGGEDANGKRRIMVFPKTDQGYHEWDSTNHPGDSRYKKWRYKNGVVNWVQHEPDAADRDNVEAALSDKGLRVNSHRDWASGEMLGASPFRAMRDKLDEFGKAWSALVAPPTSDNEARDTALLTRENVAELAARREQMHAQLKTVRKNFDAMPVAARFDFMHRMETGQAQATPALDGIARTLRQAFDDRVQDVRALGTGKLQQAITDYFPHIWKDPKAAADVYRQIFSKKPLEGSGNFLKKRSIPTIRDGMQWRVYDKDGTFDHTAPDEATAKADAATLGGHTGKPLEPISTNPVDLAVLKAHEMDRYITAHRILNEMKSRGLASFVPATRKAPDGYQKIDDKIGTVMGPNVTQGLSAQTRANLGSKQSFVEAQTIRGHYYAPEGAARIINNYLSPGLAGNMLYDVVRGVNNHMNTFQLGFSGFHASGVTLNASISKMALALKQAFDGNIGQALGSVARIPTAPFEALSTGSKVLKEMIRPGSQGADIARLAQSVIEAGGRGKMDAAYQTGAIKSFMDSWRNGSKAVALLKAPFAAMEGMMHPLMAEFVPRIKLGVFADMARYELDRMPPGTDTMGQRAILAKAWDSVDNRFGQLAYDNLFWNKTLKDIAQVSTRSVGWNLGTIRELGGGAVEGLKAPYNIVRGNGIQHNLAYTMALPAMVALFGSVYQYLHTGQGPQDLMDYFNPRTGRTLADGTPERSNLPTYWKDQRSYLSHPFVTLGNKISPIFAALSQMISNKDYYNTQIIPDAGPKDSAAQSMYRVASSELKFVAKQFVPFSLQADRQRQAKTPEAWVEGKMGITPAPAETVRSKAMTILHDYHQSRSAGTHTQAEAANWQTKSELMSALRPVPGQPPDISPAAAVQRAIKAGLSVQDAKAVLKESREPAKLLPFRGVPIDVAQRAYDAGTPEEKKLWAPTLAQKRFNASKRGQTVTAQN